MASKPLQPSRVELYEPSLTNPTPLRIVKRPKAQPYSSPIRSMPQSRGTSTTPDSPPDPPEKQLTIRKLRKKRAGLLESTDEAHTGSVILAMVQQKASPCHDTSVDIERTPKPKPKEKIGNYVKEELFRNSSDSEHNKSIQCDLPADAPERQHLASVRTSSDQGLKISNSSFSLCSESGTENSPTPKRKLSRGKRFIQKAIGSFGGARSKSLHILRSDSFTKNSKESLMRIVSRKSQKAASSMSSAALNSVSSDSSSDLDSCTRVAHHRSPIPRSFYSPDRLSTDTSWVNMDPIELLVPKISVVQGSHNIVDGDENTVWVAIEISGVCVKDPANYGLSAAREYYRHRNDYGFSKHYPAGAGCNNIKGDDCLYELNINIRPSVGCRVELVIGDTEEPRTIKNLEAELLIAKIRFADIFRTSTHPVGHDGQSAENLIAELESRLSECATDFLDVTLTYKHTALQFLEHLAQEGSSAVANQNTKLFTEARVAIRRHDYLATWSPRGPDLDGSLSDIIRNRFPVDKAEDIIQQMSSHSRMRHFRKQTMLNRNSSWSSSVSTITLVKDHRPSQAASCTMKDESAKIAPLRLNHSSCSNSTLQDSTPVTSSRELDPARKIWSEMRRNSKGTRPTFSIKTLTDEFSADDRYMELERQRISEQAIRNKRSLGADTLRSIVDDRERDRERGAEDQLHGVTVGGWGGWGPIWW